MLPVSEHQHGIARDFLERGVAKGLRPRLFDQAETLSRRMVANHDLLIPVMAVLGKREAQDVSVTLRSKHGQWTTAWDEAFARLISASRERRSEIE